MVVRGVRAGLGLMMAGLMMVLACAACTVEGPPVAESAGVGKGDVEAAHAAQVNVGQLTASARERDVTVRRIASFSPKPALLQKPTQRVVGSAEAFERYFGEAPTGIDFPREWAVFYTPGPQRSGGYAADVGIKIHPTSGRSLRIRRTLLTPGRGCMQSQAALSTPFFFGAFVPPASVQRPQDVRYFFHEGEHECGEGLCGEPLMRALADAAKDPNGEDFLHMSEGDYPFDAIDLGPIADGEPINIGTVADRALEKHLFDRVLADFREYGENDIPTDHAAILALMLEGDGEYMRARERDFDPWFTNNRARELTPGELEGMDGWQREHWEGYRRIYKVLRDNLSDLKLYRYFDVEVHMLFVGRSQCGHLVGYRTVSIET